MAGAYKTDVDDVPPGKQVLLFCLVGGQITTFVAQRHWFVENDSRSATTRRLAWRSTWNGDEMPAQFTPYAYQEIEAPDPGAAEEAAHRGQ